MASLILIPRDIFRYDFFSLSLRTERISTGKQYHLL